MKNFGFTLAEVLITLGIIGVVSALTTPVLIQNTGTAQIGPKLAKAVSAFEVANQNMLMQAGAETLSSANAFVGSSNSDAVNYINNLSNYMKISYYKEVQGGQDYSGMLKNYNNGAVTSGAPGAYSDAAKAALENYGISKDGFLFGVYPMAATTNTTVPTYNRFNGIVLIDINGTAKPNKLGRDAFYFALYSDGTLKPVGSNNWSDNTSLNSSYNWASGSTDKCNEGTVTTGWTCAGSVFENNQKVIY